MTKDGKELGVRATSTDGKRADAFVERVERLLSTSDRTQREVASAMGYTNANVVSMFKTGVTRMPLDKVESFAAAIGVDKGELVRLWMNTYMKTVRGVIERAVGMPLTAAEHSWVAGLQEVFGENVPHFDDEARVLIRLLARARGTPPAIPE